MPLPGFVLPLLGAGASIGANALTRRWKRKEENDRRKYEQKQELGRRTYDQAMWDKVNSFNHPIKQMERLTGAGLNPNLIYGSSPGSAVGNAQSIASGKQLQGQAPQYQLDNPMTPYMDTRVKQAQSNNMDADAKLKLTQAIKTGKDAGISGIQLKYLEDTLQPRTALANITTEISTIKRDLDRGMKPHLISNQMHISQKNKIGAAILAKEDQLMGQGYYKGNMIATLMKGVFNLDLSNPKDRTIAQVVASAALASQFVGNLAGSFKKALEALKSYKR
jgi:hypothetical protein